MRGRRGLTGRDTTTVRADRVRLEALRSMRYKCGVRREEKRRKDQLAREKLLVTIASLYAPQARTTYEVGPYCPVGPMTRAASR